MRILIFQPRMFGDIILGTTAAKQLKKTYPDSQITYITSHKALTETNPYIDVSYERHLPKRFEKIYFQIVKKFYDKSFHLKHWLPQANMLQSFMADVGLERKNFKTKLYLTKKDLSLADNYLDQCQSYNKEKKNIAIQEDFERKWNETEVIKLKKMLIKDFNLIEIGHSMKINNKQLNIRQAAAVISKCDLYLGGISANLHGAVAVGIPTIGISCAFNPKWDMPEFSQNEFIKDKSKKHITVKINPKKFCGYYAKSYLTEEFVYVHGGDYSPKKCFKEINKMHDPIAEKYYEKLVEYPCYCSIDAIDVFKIVKGYFD